VAAWESNSPAIVLSSSAGLLCLEVYKCACHAAAIALGGEVTAFPTQDNLSLTEQPS